VKAFCAARRPVIACCCKTLRSLAFTVPSAEVRDEFRECRDDSVYAGREIYQDTPPKLRDRCSTCVPPRAPSSQRRTKRFRPPARRPHASLNRCA
jgi:hypothetical protein